MFTANSYNPGQQPRLTERDLQALLRVPPGLMSNVALT